jgi:hypothetical protein
MVDIRYILRPSSRRGGFIDMPDITHFYNNPVNYCASSTLPGGCLAPVGWSLTPAAGRCGSCCLSCSFQGRLIDDDDGWGYRATIENDDGYMRLYAKKNKEKR